MIYELRHYICASGRLPALLKRFETQTLGIWKKHGINQVGFWTVQIGEGNNELHYMLAWESLAEREKKWNAFQADPEWQKARADSEKDGPIPREGQQHDPASGGLLGDEITRRCRVASTTSSTRCTISTRRRRLTRGSALLSARATSILGHA